MWCEQVVSRIFPPTDIGLPNDRCEFGRVMHIATHTVLGVRNSNQSFQASLTRQFPYMAIA